MRMSAANGRSPITLISPDGNSEAEFVPDANMLCRSLKYRGTELLDQGAGIEAYAERGATMGIPLLYPWANRLASFDYRAAGKSVSLPVNGGRIPLDDAGLPIHGVIPGQLNWEVDRRAQRDRVTARLAWNSADLFELFPFAHELRGEASLTDNALTIAITLVPTAEDAVPVSFGYHPYLRVPGAGRESWHVKLGAFRRLMVDERMIPTGEREPVARRDLCLGHQSFDDGFDALSVPAEFEVAAEDFALTVRFLEGFSYAQVYAPIGHDFICFEPMTAPTNALNSGAGLALVRPGAEYRAAFSVAISAGAGSEARLGPLSSARWKLVR
jgi:galactose mutarotase-like enzyme